MGAGGWGLRCAGGGGCGGLEVNLMTSLGGLAHGIFIFLYRNPRFIFFSWIWDGGGIIFWDAWGAVAWDGISNVCRKRGGGVGIQRG